MLNFQVPQFIEIEDKIFGPLTFKQFVYVTGGAGLCFLIWVYLPIKFLAVLLILPVLGLALALAFYKINNRPFILTLEAAFRYTLTHKLYIWKHGAGAGNDGGEKNNVGTGNFPAASSPRGLAIPKLSESKLKDLAWSLDIREKVR